MLKRTKRERSGARSHDGGVVVEKLNEVLKFKFLTANKTDQIIQGKDLSQGLKHGALGEARPFEQLMGHETGQDRPGQSDSL